MKRSNNAGITIIEVVVGVAIVGVVIAMVAVTMTLLFTTTTQTLNRTQALYALEEGQEIMRYLRDDDWDTLASDISNDTTYYLLVATSTLGTTTVPEVIDGTFTRSFALRAVRRDNSTDDVVTSGGSIDSDARYAVFSVAWENSTTTATSVLTNLHNL